MKINLNLPVYQIYLLSSYGVDEFNTEGFLLLYAFLFFNILKIVFAHNSFPLLHYLL